MLYEFFGANFERFGSNPGCDGSSDTHRYRTDYAINMCMRNLGTESRNFCSLCQIIKKVSAHGRNTYGSARDQYRLFGEILAEDAGGIEMSFIKLFELMNVLILKRYPTAASFS